jgi:acetoin utilization protein AcuB
VRSVCTPRARAPTHDLVMSPTPIAKIRQFMTTCPHTIESDAGLTEARLRMMELRARHLPVVDRGRLVGIVSARDIALCESLLAEPTDAATVREAMTANPFTCGPDAHLHAVAREMETRRIGSAVVVDPGHPTKVMGVFTTTDALAALAMYAPQESA